MTPLFVGKYAENYDRFYQAKDYRKECDLLELFFSRYGTGVRTVLDLGCGTGTHAIELASRGYEVTGIDSSMDMLTIAREKSGNGKKPVFIQGDIQTLYLDQQFDSVVMMFTVLGYMTGKADLQFLSESVKRHLKPGGLFIADFWYGPAVNAQGFRINHSETEVPGGNIIRESFPLPTVHGPFVDLTLRIKEMYPNRSQEHVEHHTLRYFSNLDLDQFFAKAGLDKVHMSGWPEIEQEPSEQTWNVVIVGRRI